MNPDPETIQFGENLLQTGQDFLLLDFNLLDAAFNGCQGIRELILGTLGLSKRGKRKEN